MEITGYNWNSRRTSEESVRPYAIPQKVFQSQNLQQNHDNENLKEPTWKYRYVVTISAFLLTTLENIHRSIMSIAIVAMVNHTAVNQNSDVESQSCSELIPNTTEDSISYGITSSIQDGDFNWSPKTQGTILGTLFIGVLVSLLISGRLAETYGCKFIQIGSLILASILTMLIPPLSQFHATVVIVIQLLRGFTVGMLGPTTSLLMSNWCPKTERGFLYSLTNTARAFGILVTDIFSGYIIQSAGWPSVFYIVGGFGLVLTVYFYFFLFENPKDHPYISKAELNFILNNQESKLSKRRPKLPWRLIFTSVPVYALMAALFGRFWKYAQFMTVYSTFLGTILHYPIAQNGLLSGIPFLATFVVSIIASSISGYLERKKIVTVSVLRKSWIMLSSLTYSLCLLGTYFSGCNRTTSVTWSVLSMGISGVGGPSYLVVIQDMSPSFAGTLHSLTVFIGSLSSVIVPVLVGHMTDNNQTLEQWNKIFLISIGVVMATAIIFAIFGSAKIQPWNFVEEENKENVEKQSENKKKEEKTHF